MIPKIVHYCWFGQSEMPALSKRCIESWKAKLPDFEIKRWDESNAPVEIPFVKDMLGKKKWAFASDYVRLYALYNEGGVYFDTDIEVVQEFTPLLDDECFIGYESLGRVNTGVAGSIVGAEYIKQCMLFMEERHNKNLDYWIAPEVASAVHNKNTKLATAYPPEYFYPFNPYDRTVDTDILMFADIKPETYAIHHWNHSWKMSFVERSIRFAKKVLGV